MYSNSKNSFLLKLIYASYIVVPILFLSIKKETWSNNNFIISNIKNTLVQIDQQLFIAKSILTQNINNYFSLVNTNKYNINLKEKIIKLKANINTLEKTITILSDNKINTQLDNLTDSNLVIAQVFSNQGLLEFSSLRINKGKKHGIKRGYPVITPDGVVGKISDTSDSYSEVRTILDNNFTVDSIVERTRFPGMVKGNKNNSYEFQIEKKADIRVGDRIVTSGLIASFPKHLAVGTVSKIIIDQRDLVQSVYLDPAVKIKTTKQVFVVKKNLEHISNLQKLSSN
jgi:rod shape-determining protein MreC